MRMAQLVFTRLPGIFPVFPVALLLLGYNKPVCVYFIARPFSRAVLVLKSGWNLGSSAKLSAVMWVTIPKRPGTAPGAAYLLSEVAPVSFGGPDCFLMFF
jgi:hypothetical protein